MSPISPIPELAPLQAVRVIGGKYNGLQGTLLKVCDQFGSIDIEYEHKHFEEVIELKFLTPLAAWLAAKSATELQLLGHGPQAS